VSADRFHRGLQDLSKQTCTDFGWCECKQLAKTKAENQVKNQLPFGVLPKTGKNRHLRIFPEVGTYIFEN